MPYAATINTPGYLPETDPAYFDTIREAWEYLTDERNDAWNDTEDMGPDYDPAMAQMGDMDTTGVIYGRTPGYDGEHDLGLAYHVATVPGALCPDCGDLLADVDALDAHGLDTHLEARTQ